MRQTDRQAKARRDEGVLPQRWRATVQLQRMAMHVFVRLAVCVCLCCPTAARRRLCNLVGRNSSVELVGCKCYFVALDAAKLWRCQRCVCCCCSAVGFVLFFREFFILFFVLLRHVAVFIVSNACMCALR